MTTEEQREREKLVASWTDLDWTYGVGNLHLLKYVLFALTTPIFTFRPVYLIYM